MDIDDVGLVSCCSLRSSLAWAMVSYSSLISWGVLTLVTT